ncbi:HIT family protein [Patescibacteria group bacterium]
MDSKCIFCKIVNDEIPSYKVWENENFIAILDIFPINRGMTLIISKNHLPSYVIDLDNKTLLSVLDAMKEVTTILDKKLEESIRTTYFIEGLDVDHLHVKLIPFYEKDKNREIPPKADDQELSRLAQYLRS